jgi:hypothetical protein
MQSVGSIIVSVTFVSINIARLMDMESVIKSNTKGMREIVTKLEKAVKDKNKEIDQLKKLNEKLAVGNEKMKKEVSVIEIQNTEELKLKKAFQMEKRTAEKMKTHLDAIRISNGVLEKKIEKLEKNNRDMSKKLMMNEEDIDFLVEVNKPLEKAYKSLQRKYQVAVDQLELRKKKD